MALCGNECESKSYSRSLSHYLIYCFFLYNQQVSRTTDGVIRGSGLFFGSYTAEYGNICTIVYIDSEKSPKFSFIGYF
jgi:hypothetical protein